MKLENSKNIIRIWLDDRYAIRQYIESNLIVLEYYRFGTDHMPDEIFYGKTLFETIKRYEKEVK